MGQRYEKSRKNVTENRQILDRLRDDKDTLQKEYAPLSELAGIWDLLDDEAADAIHQVTEVETAESARIADSTETAEKEKDAISHEIQHEVDKLRSGLDRLQSMSRFEFGKNAAAKGTAEYKRQIEKFNSLLAELGEDVSDAPYGGAEGAEVPAGDSPYEGHERMSEEGDASLIGVAINSALNPLSPAVRAWSDRLDSLSAQIQQQYAQKYSSYIPPEKLDRPLSETVKYETIALLHSRGLEDGVLGYNDGRKSHIAVGTGHELQTTVHENLHQLSANGANHGIITYSSSGRQNVQINEAITELLTQRTLGSSYGPDYSAYSDNRDAMALIENVVGEDTVCQAYFQNRPNLLQSQFESLMGPGSWRQMSEAFDDSLSRQYHTRISGQARRNDLINRFMIAAERARGGSEDWTEMLL